MSDHVRERATRAPRDQGAARSRGGTVRPPRAGRPRLALPGWLLIPAVVGATLIMLPVVGMILRIEPGQLWSLITSEASLDALWLSLRTAAVSTVACILLGTPMALILARTSFPGHRFVRSVVLLPLVLPPVVGGLALLYVFGRVGLLGRHLEALGIEIAFSTAAVVLAQTFVALPFLVVGVEGALRSAGDQRGTVEGTGHIRGVSAGSDRCSRGNSAVHHGRDLGTVGLGNQRAHVGVVVQRVTHHHGLHQLGHALGERLKER